MTSVSGLTICSVSYNSRPWLEMSRRLAVRLNPHNKLTWIVAENSPTGSPLACQPDDTCFHVIPGAAFESRSYASASYHHGRAMNLTLSHIKSRYVLFCDPDFFIVRKDWAQTVLAHMTTAQLGIFGAPWHPRWVYKYRYFPCVHCLYVDLDRVPLDWLDFTPDYEGVPGYARVPDPPKRAARSRVLAMFKWPDPLKLRKRRYIGCSHDVSWRIAQRVSTDPHVRVECLKPVFRPERGGLQSVVDRLLPDRLSLVPKRGGYFTELRFKDCGLPDLNAWGWEEFMWLGEPFGFHVRSQPKLKGNESVDAHLAQVIAVLRSFSTLP